MSYWQGFVQQFFSPRGVFRLNLVMYPDSENKEQEEKLYEIPQAALARYFHINFQSGITNMQLTLEKGTMDKSLPGGCHFIENQKAAFIHWLENSHVVWHGTVRAQFDAEQKIDMFEFVTTSHDEYLSRKQVIAAAMPSHTWVKKWNELNNDPKNSPEMSKKSKTKQHKSPAFPPPDLELPDTPIKSNSGITKQVTAFLEVSSMLVS